MTTLSIGYLFEKKYITYESKKWEIFEYIDYVTGITYVSKDGNEICHVMTGNKAGIYATRLNINANEGNYVFLEDNLDKAIEENNRTVNFSKIRENKLSRTAKYYTREKGKTILTAVLNEDLRNYLEMQSNNKREFDEEVFEKNTDISTMYSSVKKTIISQDEPIMKILTSLFKNQKVVNSNLDLDLIAKLKENILIYGSTGTGKTEILKRISKLYNIPIVIEDATSLSETGYQGRNVTDMLEDLYQAANGNIEAAQKGILVIDEFDKLAEKQGDTQSHVSRLGVQRSLLKLLDGSLFYFGNKKFDTSRLTVVALGAFTGITDGDNYQDITEKNFINYGIIRELMGRFSKKIPMNPLKKEDIIKILKDSDFSPLNTYKKLFEMLNIQYEFDDDFIEYVADIAIEKNSGARSLKTVFDNCISSALFRIFAGEYTGISLVKPNNQNEKPYILTKTPTKKGLFSHK